MGSPYGEHPVHSKKMLEVASKSNYATSLLSPAELNTITNPSQKQLHQTNLMQNHLQTDSFYTATNESFEGESRGPNRATKQSMSELREK